MKTQDIALILLVTVVLILLFVRASSGFTSMQAQQIMASVPASPGLMPSVVNFLVASLQGQPLLSYANAILQQIPTQQLISPLVPYTSETQLQTMFTTAAANGEAGLTFTDRVLLRATTGIWAYLLTSPQSANILGSFTYDSQGKVSWADSILSQTGQTVLQNMLYIFQLVQASSGPITQDIIDTLNHVLPSNLTKITDPQDWNTRNATLTTANPDPTMVWVFKFSLIGPAYLAWVAENKYRLDPTFTAQNLPSSSHSMSISPSSNVPTPTSMPIVKSVPIPAP
jgi:hypothetical protein